MTTSMYGDYRPLKYNYDSHNLNYYKTMSNVDEDRQYLVDFMYEPITYNDNIKREIQS